MMAMLATMTRVRVFRLVLTVAVLAFIAACSRSEPARQDAVAGGDEAAGAQQAQAKESYPEPRFPAYLRPPENADALMPYARILVRNESGFQGRGLGILKEGESVLIVPTVNADDVVLDAVRKALAERKVTAHIVADYALNGLTKEQAVKLREAREDRSAEQGYFEASGWVEDQFPDPEKAKAWLKERNPKLYETLFPQNRTLSPELAAIELKMERDSVGDGIKRYLTKNPQVRGVFWGQGGSTGLRRALFPMQEKFLGTFLQDNRYDLMSQMSSYPGDVWQLAEEQLLEPIVYAGRIEATDPEGTNVWADLTEEMAQRWAQGSYQRGHLYMFPNQATGRFGYSFVDYPAFQQKWLPREPKAIIQGVIVGTSAGGFFPRREVHFKDGYISEVKGGGPLGEALKEFLDYPGLKDLVYPYHKTPGYWYLYEIAFGSHPKAFRHPSEMLYLGSTGAERARSGVIHWGLGIRLWHDPDAPTESKTWIEFTKKHNVPKDHNWHTFTFFTTYRIKLRGTEDKWVTLLDKGRMTSLDNPEVRALASRYGDPTLLLAEDWVPDVPGINAPGDYMRDYAPAPYTHAKNVIDKVVAGTYEHYFPKTAAKPTTTSAAPVSGTATGGK
jgi:hypothetical protein